MRISTCIAIAASVAAIVPAGAQQARTHTITEFRTAGQSRAALGVGTTATGTLRDTLGVMISSITAGGPAERAGLEEGNRIAAINGVSLRANAADIEDTERSGTLTRRLTRELAKAKPGDEVELRIYREGRNSTVRVRTADADSLFRRRATVRYTRADLDERPAIGITLGTTGSRRDTLGVLVMSVGDSTPAARAGIEEGNRIAAINGVSLRVAGEDAGDRYMGGIKAQRLQREIAALKPGTDVTLRVYSNGQFRDVRLKVARAGDLPRDRGRTMIFGGANGFGGMMPAIAPMPPMPPMMPHEPMPGRPSRPTLAPVAPGSVHEDALIDMGPQLQEHLEMLRPELERVRIEAPHARRPGESAALL